MPRENRKRGKKHKPQKDEPEPIEQAVYEEEEHAAPEDQADASDAPFGYVDPDVKAYFRTIDDQLREWQGDYGDAEEAAELKEDRRNFLVAALSEMAGKELQLATDPDCAAIVERILHSMDDFLKRVFVDRLSGSFEQLMAHRFASHVCQTIFTMAGSTVARELRGELPSHPDAAQLRTLTRLVIDASEEIMPKVSSFISHPFASHVLRALLILLCPSIAPEDSEKNLRSKKSASFRAKQGPMKSIFTPESRLSSGDGQRPDEFAQVAANILKAITSNLGENEIRALAADKVGSPTLQLIVELEAHCGLSDTPGSVMDHLLVGLVSATHSKVTMEPSDYLTTILHDSTSSRLLETLVSRSPDAVFRNLWRVYFAQSGRLQKLAVHPVANFVVARCVMRLDTDEFAGALNELGGSWIRMRKAARFGVLKSFIDRATILHEHAASVAEAAAAAFEIESEDDRKLVVQTILRQMTPSEYRSAFESVGEKSSADASSGKPKRWQRTGEAHDALEPKVQGALLLQSLLHLPEPHHSIVVDSLLAQTPEELLALAHHPISSRVLDEAFTPTMVPRVRKALVQHLIGHFHTLADDRIGSRVAERAWGAIDTYLKEKVARSLLPHENFLTGSHFGRFFARIINLSLLQRRPDDWRAMQTAKAREATAQNVPQPPVVAANSSQLATKKEERKRKRETAGDEIDQLFAKGASKKKHKVVDGETKQSTVTEPVREEARNEKPSKKHKRGDLQADGTESLDANVLQAIRSAPHDYTRKPKPGRRKE
ncbi:ARM repeat-containing protein [Auriculariales sp. MPI-PUGE-AT-0066]|nr:ARM repeat-containing protein [Auriculariales sp. MPI-PUGE-AT-0066]